MKLTVVVKTHDSGDKRIVRIGILDEVINSKQNYG